MSTVREKIIDALTLFWAKISTVLVRKANIVDNCASTSTEYPLSANQGTQLQSQIDTLNTNLDKDCRSNPIVLHAGNIYNTALQTWEYTNISGLSDYQEIIFTVHIGDCLAQTLVANRNLNLQYIIPGYYDTAYNGVLHVTVDFENSRIGVFTKKVTGWDYVNLKVYNIIGTLKL